MIKLDTSFYQQDVVTVAKALIGKTLVFGDFKGIIMETEAYRGRDDEASHAFRGITPRTKIMFGAPGYSYVYLIYGMYYCLNIVAEAEGNAAAVLIRGLKLPDIYLNGPGKLTKQLGITKMHHGIHVVSSDLLYVTGGTNSLAIEATPRIGIKKAIDKLWRFVMV